MNKTRAYEIFGNIPAEQLKKKYYKLALENHPDKNGNTEESKKKFQEINDAYEYLKEFINYFSIGVTILVGLNYF
jgi:DnaJ-class molecular chaperone